MLVSPFHLTRRLLPLMYDFVPSAPFSLHRSIRCSLFQPVFFVTSTSFPNTAPARTRLAPVVVIPSFRRGYASSKTFVAVRALTRADIARGQGWQTFPGGALFFVAECTPSFKSSFFLAVGLSFPNYGPFPQPPPCSLFAGLNLPQVLGQRISFLRLVGEAAVCPSVRQTCFPLVSGSRRVVSPPVPTGQPMRPQ